MWAYNICWELYRTLISGLYYPIPAAAACGIWTFTRIMYTIGYGSGEPKKVFSFSTESDPGGEI